MHFVRLDFLWVSEDTSGPSGQQFLGVIQWVASPSLPCFPVQQGFDMTLGYFLWVSHGFTRQTIRIILASLVVASPFPR